MKSCLAMTMACAVLLGSVSASAEQIATKPNPAYGIARGFANLMTGWLELPRGLVYENARIPVVGFVSGPVKGAALMTWRTLAGTMDVVCMGLTREGLYTEQVPDFVWDADWVPKCGEDMASMESIESKPCAEKPKVVKKRKVIIKAPCEQMQPKAMMAAPCAPCEQMQPKKVIIKAAGEKMQPKKVKKVKVKKWKAR